MRYPATPTVLETSQTSDQLQGYLIFQTLLTDYVIISLPSPFDLLLPKMKFFSWFQSTFAAPNLAHTSDIKHICRLYPHSVHVGDLRRLLGMKLVWECCIPC